MRRKMRNAFDRFQLAGIAGAPATPPQPVGSFVTYEPSGEAGAGPHYTVTDDEERITWDDPGA